MKITPEQSQRLLQEYGPISQVSKEDAYYGPTLGLAPVRPRTGFGSVMEASFLNSPILGSVLNGLGQDKFEPVQGFNPMDHITPQLEPYAEMLKTAGSPQRFVQMKEFYLNRERREATLAEAGFFKHLFASLPSQVLDPANLAINMATGFTATAASRRFMSSLISSSSVIRNNALSRTAALATQYPVRFNAAQGAVFGAADAFVSSYAQDTASKMLDPLGVDDTHKLENAVYSAMFGMFFGGAAGAYHGKKASKLKQQFQEAAKYIVENDKPEFVGPTQPQTILASGMEQPEKASSKGSTEVSPEAPKPLKSSYPDMILASGEEKPKLTPSEERARLLELGKQERLNDVAEQANRIQFYNQVKSYFDMLAPNKLIGFFNQNILKLSPTNRLVGSDFGSARMAAAQLARIPYEFAGTLLEKAMPMPVELKILAAKGELLNIRTNHHKHFASYNKRAEVPMSIDEFNKAVGTHMLLVGQEGQAHSIPEIEASAKEYRALYDKFNKLLVNNGIIEEGFNTYDMVNYLNKMADRAAMAKDFEGAVEMQASWMRHVNERLKRLMPLYRPKLEAAKKASRDAKRFLRMADNLEKQEKRVGVEKTKEKIAKLDSKRDEKLAKAKAQYEERLKAIPDKAEGAFAELKESLKNAFDLYKKEVKAATKFYDSEIKDLKRELKKKRDEYRGYKEDVFSGKNDKAIKEEYAREIEGTLAENTGDIYTATQLKEQAREYAEIEFEYDPKEFRKGYLEQTGADLKDDVNLIVNQLNDLKREKRELKKQLFEEIKQESLAVADAIKEAGNLDKKAATTMLRDKIAKIKFQAKERAINVEYNNKYREITREFVKHERKKQRYSLVGYQYEFELKQQLDAIEMLRDIQGDNFVKSEKAMAKKALRDIYMPTKSIDEMLANPIEIKANEVSKNLLSRSETLLEEADKIIPDYFKSETTGMPYPIFNEETHPTYVIDSAETTIRRYLGRSNDVTINPTFSALMNGNPKSLKARTNKLPDTWPGADKFFVRDIEVLSESMINAVAPVLAMADLAKTLNTIPAAKSAYRRILIAEKINQGMNKDVAYARVTLENMPDITYKDVGKVLNAMIVEESQSKMAGLKGEERYKLENQTQKAVNDLGAVMKQVMGLDGGGYNTDSKYASDLVDLANGAASTVLNSNIFMSFMQDFLVPTTQFGFSKVINNWARMLTSPELRSLSKQEANALGNAIKVAQSNWVAHEWSGNPNSPKATTFAYNLQALRRKLAFVTGSSITQDMVLNTSTALAQTQTLEACLKFAAGTLDKKGSRYLGKFYIDSNMAKDIAMLYEKFGYEKEGGLGIDPSNASMMTPRDAAAFQRLRESIFAQVETFHGNVGLVAKTGFEADNPIAKMFMFLKSYFFKVTTDVLVPAGQRWDAAALEGYLAMLAGGMLSSELRAIARGEDRSDMSLKARIYEGLDAGGNLGIASILGAGTAAQLLGVTENRFGTGGLSAPTIGLTSQIANNLSRWMKIMTDEDTYMDEKQIRQTLSFIPAARFLPISIGLRVALNEED